MNPLGKHFGLMTAGDLICLDVNSGKVVGGNRSRTANSAGFFIHSEIHKARPDVHAICHAHTNAGRAWSSFATGLDMLNQDICDLYNAIAVYANYGGIVFAEEEGKNIARSLGEKNKVCIHPIAFPFVRINTKSGCYTAQPRPPLNRQYS
jgi:ribulose-5-phosphate 4-epimerase/fuculose-1-phosphate aldolase